MSESSSHPLLPMTSASTRVVMKEFKHLQSAELEDIHIHPLNDDGNLSLIEATIDGPPQTPFVEGSFKIRLVVGGDYPQQPPKGYFLTKIFHPNVAPQNGEICVNTLKKEWNGSTMNLLHVLQVIRCLLIVPNPESALNEEAGRLLLENYDDYSRRAALMTKIHAKRVTAAADATASSSSATSAASADNNKENGAQTNSATSTSTAAPPSPSKAATTTAAQKQAADKTAKAKKNLKRL